MKLWIKGARQVVRVVANKERMLCGIQQQNCNLAIIEETNGVGVSIIIDELLSVISFPLCCMAWQYEKMCQKLNIFHK